MASRLMAVTWSGNSRYSAAAISAAYMADDALRAPSRASLSATGSGTIILLLTCLMLQGGAVFTAYASGAAKVAHLEMEALRVDDFEEREALISSHQWSYARRIATVHIGLTVVRVVVLTCVWFAIGALLRARHQRLFAVFSAIIVGATISTVGVLLRFGIALAMGADPGPLTLEQFGRQFLPAVPAAVFARVDVIAVWWGLAVGATLAHVWRKPAHFVQLLTVASAMLWAAASAHGH